MDAKKITEILHTLDIVDNMDCYDIRERISNENLKNIVSCYRGC